MKVHLREYHELTTQVYFKEEAHLNNLDRILRSLPAHDQQTTVVSFEKRNHGSEHGILRTGHFDVQLQKN